MRILLTGAEGRLGRVTRTLLTQAGHSVFGVDLIPSVQTGTTMVDLTNYGELIDAVHGIADRHDGVDAVVHLGAISASGLASDERTFRSNLTSTFNVLQACARAEISTLVFASSIVVAGTPFTEPPPFLPIDESVAGKPESNYALSKHLEEQMAEQFARWHPDWSIVAMRFSNVLTPEHIANFADHEAQPESRKAVLWGYVDARDAARAIVHAIEARPPGFEAVLIAQQDTTMQTPTRDLVGRYFPGVEIRSEFAGHTGLVSTAKAERLLGFRPVERWRNGQDAT